MATLDFSLNDPLVWKDALEGNPPRNWQQHGGDFFYFDGTHTFEAGGNRIATVDSFASELTPGRVLRVVGELNVPLADDLWLEVDVDGGKFQTIVLPQGETAFSQDVTLPSPGPHGFLGLFARGAQSGDFPHPADEGGPAPWLQAIFAWVTECPTIRVNCDCEDENPNRTLGEMRTDLLRRLGYSAQAANPPPGMTELLDSFLNGAYRMVHRTYASLRTERMFTWTMTPGGRFYALRGNDELADADFPCDKVLDPYRVTWAGVEDRNGTWYPLRYGIPPEFYTSAPLTTGWPSHYEIRSCVEVFPAPAEECTRLRIKGHFDIGDMVEDADKPDVDSEVVFLLALANAKAHYGQPDGARYEQQAFTRIQSLVAGTHVTRRYVPGGEPEAPLPTPIFLPVE